MVGELVLSGRVCLAPDLPEEVVVEAAGMSPVKFSLSSLSLAMSILGNCERSFEDLVRSDVIHV